MSSLQCIDCGTRYPAREARWRCGCGGLLDLVWKHRFDPACVAGREPTLWRYREALPLGDGARAISMGEGMTQLLELVVDSMPVLIKQDHVFPSGSYKDRGASVLVSKVDELGIDRVVEDSSGNAGAAIAAYCARAGIECAIYVPSHTSPAKVAQIESYGADLRRVPGSREDTAAAAMAAAQRVYYASHTWNPYFLHGTKTFAYEVCEQLGWQAPDTVILPVGNGTLLLGAAIGFRELRRSGVIGCLPALVGVQAAACAPLYHAWRSGAKSVEPGPGGPTVAEGIAIASPVRARQILAAVRESGGGFVSVTDDEILRAHRTMCTQGFYIEPTAAATIAGVRAIVQRHRESGIIVSTFTGHGLKATKV